LSIADGGYFSGYYYQLSLNYIAPAIGEILLDTYPTLIILLLLISLLIFVNIQNIIKRPNKKNIF